MRTHRDAQTEKKSGQKRHDRLALTGILLIAILGVIVFRLFTLMVVNNLFYLQLADGSHDLYAKLYPNRGTIYLLDTRTDEEFPVAMNTEVFLMFADTRQIQDDDTAQDVATALSSVLSYNDEKKLSVYLQLNKRTDPYEPLEQELELERSDAIRELHLPGIYFIKKTKRFYPEKKLAAQVIGFVGKDSEGAQLGQYGIEGYWNKELSGIAGFFEGVLSGKGEQIPLAGKKFEEAQDGADIVLTIDRTLQFNACERLRKGMEEYGSQSASLTIIDPKTGAILAMCSLPDFDANKYNEVESAEMYNNTNIFVAYEPGSVFKPIAMSGALNEEIITPNSIFYDSGSREAGCTKPIRNALDRIYQDQTMTGVLENSVNTGMVYVTEQLGKKRFIEYINAFGFGVREGIELDSEVGGNVDTLNIKKGDDIDCYTATAAFGQGITATPLQMVTAFGAIANQGMLMKPYVVKEIRYPDGRVERTKPESVQQVLSPRAANLIAGMLVSVIDNGHAKSARVPGYYIAGKTGTAQIAGPGGYTEETIHSFIGFGPVDDPKFVMIVKYEKPQRAFSESTAAPVFSDVSKFITQYYSIPPGR